MALDSLVSVVIPTISSRDHLFNRAVKSVMNQTYKNIEIIPVKDKRAAEARNTGIKRARGKFIAFLDDDDEWLPTKIEKQIKAFCDNVQLVICWIDDRRFGKGYVVEYNTEIFLYDVLKMFNLASTSAYMFRTKYLKENQFDTTFPSAQEYELAIRTAAISKIKCIPEVLVIQHASVNQITRNWKKKKEGLSLLLKKYKHLYYNYTFGKYIKFRIEFFVLQCLYSLAHVFGDKIYKIIIHFKKMR